MKGEQKQRRAVALRGGVQGGLIGAGIVFPTFYLLNRRSSQYHSFPLPVKLLGGVVAVTPLVAIYAEKKTVEFDRWHWTEFGKSQLQKREHEERERWAALSRKDKIAEWVGKHQLSITMGSWATTMAIAGSIIMRDPLLTMPQKAVQVRLWAQGLTVGIVIIAAVLTHARRAQVMEIRKGNHSWRYALEDNRLEKDLPK